MVHRHLADVVGGHRGKYPVITITGPRQSGKTTLARAVFPDLPYASFENPDVLEYATDDPRGFLARYPDGAVFDEVQRAPEIIQYLQQIVDEAGPRVCYVLTGSQQFGLVSRVSQSLAGRSAVVHLLPFSLAERYPSGVQADLDEILHTGLYPPIHDRGLDPGTWFDSYIQLYVERDVRQLINVRDLGTFSRFVRLCAGRTGQMLNRTQLADDTGVSVNTASAWLSVLEASYLVFFLQPHLENFNKRLVKSPKLYFYDVGLAARLLGIQSPRELAFHSWRGHLFETFVVSEMMKQEHNRGALPRLFWWRNSAGLEIDLLAEHAEKLQPIEIKAGATITRGSFTGIERWLELAGDRATLPTLIYGGDEAGDRRGVRYRSWRSLAGEPREPGRCHEAATRTP